MNLASASQSEISLPQARVRSALEIVAVLARWGIGLFFLYMGLNKALHPVEFLKLVRQYELVQSFWLLNVIAATLPWFEVFCALLLLAGVAVRGAALVMLGMLIPFTVLVAKRALAIQAAKGLPFCAIKFDCGCGAGEVFICSKIIENFCLTLVCAWLLYGFGRRWAARYSLR